MKYIKRDYGFTPEPDDPDSLGNDPQVVAAYYAFIAGYEAAKQTSDGVPATDEFSQ